MPVKEILPLDSRGSHLDNRLLGLPAANTVGRTNVTAFTATGGTWYLLASEPSTSSSRPIVQCRDVTPMPSRCHPPKNDSQGLSDEFRSVLIFHRFSSVFTFASSSGSSTAFLNHDESNPASFVPSTWMLILPPSDLSARLAMAGNALKIWSRVAVNRSETIVRLSDVALDAAPAKAGGLVAPVLGGDVPGCS